ncbi:unnamed protein product [Amoebophrya sp. A25]|nr:unnamed protein product [Amoebophrya sp. A25]|eukprot:GSA25T00010377001.1
MWFLREQGVSTEALAMQLLRAVSVMTWLFAEETASPLPRLTPIAASPPAANPTGAKVLSTETPTAASGTTGKEAVATTAEDKNGYDLDALLDEGPPSKVRKLEKSKWERGEVEGRKAKSPAEDDLRSVVRDFLRHTNLETVFPLEIFDDLLPLSTTATSSTGADGSQPPRSVGAKKVQHHGKFSRPVREGLLVILTVHGLRWQQFQRDEALRNDPNGTGRDAASGSGETGKNMGNASATNSGHMPHSGGRMTTSDTALQTGGLGAVGNHTTGVASSSNPYPHSARTSLHVTQALCSLIPRLRSITARRICLSFLDTCATADFRTVWLRDFEVLFQCLATFFNTSDINLASISTNDAMSSSLLDTVAGLVEALKVDHGITYGREMVRNFGKESDRQHVAGGGTMRSKFGGSVFPGRPSPFSSPKQGPQLPLELGGNQHNVVTTATGGSSGAKARLGGAGGEHAIEPSRRGPNASSDEDEDDYTSTSSSSSSTGGGHNVRRKRHTSSSSPSESDELSSLSSDSDSQGARKKDWLRRKQGALFLESNENETSCNLVPKQPSATQPAASRGTSADAQPLGALPPGGITSKNTKHPLQPLQTSPELMAQVSNASPVNLSARSLGSAGSNDGGIIKHGFLHSGNAMGGTGPSSTSSGAAVAFPVMLDGAKNVPLNKSNVDFAAFASHHQRGKMSASSADSSAASASSGDEYGLAEEHMSQLATNRRVLTDWFDDPNFDEPPMISVPPPRHQASSSTSSTSIIARGGGGGAGAAAGAAVVSWTSGGTRGAAASCSSFGSGSNPGGKSSSVSSSNAQPLLHVAEGSSKQLLFLRFLHEDCLRTAGGTKPQTRLARRLVVVAQRRFHAARADQRAAFRAQFQDLFAQFRLPFWRALGRFLLYLVLKGHSSSKELTPDQEPGGEAKTESKVDADQQVQNFFDTTVITPRPGRPHSHQHFPAHGGNYQGQRRCLRATDFNLPVFHYLCNLQGVPPEAQLASDFRAGFERFVDVGNTSAYFREHVWRRFIDSKLLAEEKSYRDALAVDHRRVRSSAMGGGEKMAHHVAGQAGSLGALGTEGVMPQSASTSAMPIIEDGASAEGVVTDDSAIASGVAVNKTLGVVEGQVVLKTGAPFSDQAADPLSHMNVKGGKKINKVTQSRHFGDASSSDMTASVERVLQDAFGGAFGSSTTSHQQLSSRTTLLNPLQGHQGQGQLPPPTAAPKRRPNINTRMSEIDRAVLNLQQEVEAQRITERRPGTATQFIGGNVLVTSGAPAPPSKGGSSAKRAAAKLSSAKRNALLVGKLQPQVGASSSSSASVAFVDDGSNMEFQRMMQKQRNESSATAGTKMKRPVPRKISDDFVVADEDISDVSQEEAREARGRQAKNYRKNIQHQSAAALSRRNSEKTNAEPAKKAKKIVRK